MKISAIVPAFNEEKHIQHILEFLSEDKHVDELIVVDDCSTDQTGVICQQFPHVHYLKNSVNIGKTQSVLTGVHVASNSTILLFDADLIGLDHQYIQDMVRCYQNGNELVIMDLGGMDWFRHNVIKGATALSGVRLLDKKYFSQLALTGKNSFELETRINEFFLNSHLPIAVSDAPKVKTPFKFEKYNFFDGLVREIKALYQYIFINGIIGVPRLLLSWQKIYSFKNTQ